jgi:hypothetical protein
MEAGAEDEYGRRMEDLGWKEERRGSLEEIGCSRAADNGKSA